MSGLLIIPILLPLASGAAAILVKSNPRTSLLLVLTGAGLHTLASGFLLYHVHHNGILATQIGNWPAPFGITLVADHLSAVLVMITAIVNLAVTSYSKVDIDAALIGRGYYPLLQMLVCGICGAFLTGDIFNLYVWFEVMLMASFGLLVLGQSKPQLDGGVKYVVINLLATLLFLTAIGLLYGLTGTLNLADLHAKVPQIANRGLLEAVAILFLAAFGIKAALFPLFFWLPAAYHTPPVAVSAIFSGLLTKVGVYALIRVFTLVFTFDMSYFYSLLLVMAALTMITGVLGAAAQNEFRRILSFHIISQVGYMAHGTGPSNPPGPCRHHILSDSPYYCESQSVSGKRRRTAITGLIRAGAARRSVSQQRQDRSFIFYPGLFIGGLSAFIRLLGQNDSDSSQPRYPSIRVSLCGCRRRTVDGLFND